MAASALYQPQRRAARVVAPLVSKPPSRAPRCAVVPKPWVPQLVERQAKMRRRIIAERREAARSPFEKGQRAGRANRHYLPKLDLKTRTEWLEFLRGHRKGQAEFLKQEKQRQRAAIAEALR